MGGGTGEQKRNQGPTRNQNHPVYQSFSSKPADIGELSGAGLECGNLVSCACFVCVVLKGILRCCLVSCRVGRVHLQLKRSPTSHKWGSKPQRLDRDGGVASSVLIATVLVRPKSSPLVINGHAVASELCHKVHPRLETPISYRF